LVGAGPGDPGLLTVKAAALLGSADVVVSDQLISEHVLNLVPKHRLVLVERKVKGRSDAAQTDANELCLKELRMGKTVVRLKGGDPFMFGRGGEEVLFLRKHGFESVVVPGVSSCIAAPASVGIPVTHRGYADQFLVLSGRGEGGSFPDIPKHNDRRTTVVLMPVARLGALSDAMQEKGYPRDLPAAVVEKGTCLGERVVEGLLEILRGGSQRRM
ncbi:tetrapyrrole methylase, partial [Chytridium lagenaria]